MFSSINNTLLCKIWRNLHQSAGEQNMILFTESQSRKNSSICWKVINESRQIQNVNVPIPRASIRSCTCVNIVCLSDIQVWSYLPVTDSRDNLAGLNKTEHYSLIVSFTVALILFCSVVVFWETYGPVLFAKIQFLFYFLYF